MKLKPKSFIVVSLILVAALLTACGGAGAPVEVTESVAQEPTQVATQEPTAPPEQIPTQASVPEANLTEGCVEDYVEGIDYFPEKVTVEYAEAFDVEYFNNYKLVTITTPWIGGEPIRYVLVQCGTPAPEGFDPAQVIEIPVSRVVAMSTTYLPFIDQIGQIDSLVGLDTGLYVNNPAVREKLEAGELAEIGFGADVNVELALEIEPDLILTYEFGSPSDSARPVLAEAGLPVVIVSEFMENTPLGRAEWGKFIALFYNQEAQAAIYFDEAVAKYNELTALTANIAERPTVVTGSPFEGVWYVPGGNSYAARFLADAGADYLWADDTTTGSLPLDFESVFDVAVDADFWLDPSAFWSSLADIAAADERYTSFAAYQNGRVYNNTARTNENFGNDYYESGVANPHLILADLIAIFHPELLPDHELYYYVQLQ